jgi:hypothetical protein
VRGTADRIAIEIGQSLSLLADRLGFPMDVFHLLVDVEVPPELLTAWLGLDIADPEGEPAGLPPAVRYLIDAASALAGLTPADPYARGGSDTDTDIDVHAVLNAIGAVTDALAAVADEIEQLAGAGGTVPAEVAANLAELPIRMVEWLVVARLERTRPLTTRILHLLGVVERAVLPGVPPQPLVVRKRLHLQRLSQLLEDPATTLMEVHGWGDPVEPLDPVPFARLLGDLCRMFDLPILVDGITGEVRSLAFVARPTEGELPTAIELLLDLEDGIALGDEGLDLGETDSGTSVFLRASGDFQFAAGLRLEPPFLVRPIDPAAALAGRLGLVAHNPGSDGDVILFGEREGTRLVVAKWRLEAALDAAANLHHSGFGFLSEAEIDTGTLVIQLGDADAFLAAFLPADLTASFNLNLRWDSSGLTIEGGAGGEIPLSLGVRIGPVTVDRVNLAVRVDPTGIGIEARATGGISLGPLAVTMAGIGGAMRVIYGGGDHGVLDFEPRFLAPSGLGLAIAAGPVTGGGFVDFFQEDRRYEGALQLQIGEIGLQALGLVETRLPAGREGYSLLVVIRSDFPPIALPFGFLLTAVGGLLGLNRRVDVDELRSRFASGAAGRILAPEDPIANAPALLAELGAVFPVTEGVFVVGPTLQLGWTMIVRFDVGIFLELPGPSKVVMLGSVRAVIENPEGKPLLNLRLDVIGVLDPAKRKLEFDAVLIDSQLLEVFELTGGAAFRLNWGPKPHVVMSVGGFHPRYDPAPLAFPSSLTRIAMTRGRRQDAFYLRFEGYFAITSNSLQLGASAEMILRASKFVAEGSFAFDVLIRFQPFSFELDVRASLRISYGKRTLAGVKVVGTLSGPGPIDFTGKISFEILFVEISWRGSFQFGNPSAPPLRRIASVAEEFFPELGDPRNLVAVGGDDASVILQLGERAGQQPIVSPFGHLVWRQSKAPLELLLERFEGAPVEQPALLRVTGDQVRDEDRQLDWFAPGMFVDLSDAEKLNRAGFEELEAGVILAADTAIDSPAEEYSFHFEEYRIPDPEKVQGDGRDLPAWLLDAADGRIPAHRRRGVAVSMTPNRFEVRSIDTGVLLSDTGLSEAQAHQVARHGSPAGAVILMDDLVDVIDF